MAKLSDNTKQQQTVISLHIPKAAGSTLHKIIERQYKPNAIFSIDGQCLRESKMNSRNFRKRKERKLGLSRDICISGCIIFAATVYLYHNTARSS